MVFPSQPEINIARQKIKINTRRNSSIHNIIPHLLKEKKNYKKKRTSSISFQNKLKVGYKSLMVGD